MRKYGLLLVLAGLIGAAFFWLTDPKWGIVRPAGNPIDAANEAMIPTLVGLAGSGVLVLIGLWLAVRKTG